MNPSNSWSRYILLRSSQVPQTLYLLGQVLGYLWELADSEYYSEALLGRAEKYLEWHFVHQISTHQISTEMRFVVRSISSRFQ
jgi:hypothetical protein